MAVGIGAIEKRRLLERLNLLCISGAGLEAIATQATSIARDLVGADSGSIFWRDADGAPAGFYHDCASAELKDVFVTRLDELFSSSGQFNMMTMTEMVGPAVGRLIDPEGIAFVRSSNVYEYLCKPLGHEYCLDLRIEHEGRGVAVIALWNKANKRFTAKDVNALEPVRSQIELAVATKRSDIEWRSVASRTAHFVSDIKGEKLIAIDREAEWLLVSGHLLRQNLPMAQPVKQAPLFAQNLAVMLNSGIPAKLTLPVTGGRIVARAALSEQLGAGNEGCTQMFVSIDFERAADVLIAEWIASQPLTLLQKQIALFACQGGERADCETQFGVSSEALKKHLKAIYDACGAANWVGLRRTATTAAAV